MSFIRIASVLLPLVLLSACASAPEQKAEQKQDSETYQQAMEEARAGRYETAIVMLEGLKKEADSDNTRRRVDISLAYVLYKKGDLEAAHTATDELIASAPRGEDTSYLYYLQGLIVSAKGKQKLDPLMQSMSPDSAYPEELREAYAIFTKLVQDYPESAYTDDAVRRTEDLRKQLADFELHMARAELVNGDFDEVVRRTRYINEYFIEPEIRKRALVLMKKAYEQTGRMEDAERVGQQINNLVVP